MERAPLLAEAHENLGRLLLELGVPEQGKASLERARAIEPTMPGPVRELARALAFDGDLAAAEELLEPLRGSPSGAVPRARLRLWQRDVAGAQAIFDAFPDGIVQLARRVMFEGHGLDDGETDQPSRSPARPRRLRRQLYYLQLRCEALAAAGAVDQAMPLLERAAAMGFFDVTWCERCPALVALRAAPGFAAASAIVAAKAQALLVRLTAG
jgi:serine/threonine-protein kinase